MPKLTPLPTRMISDIEELRVAVHDAIARQRITVRIVGLSDVERENSVEVLVNLRVMAATIDRMRTREWDIVNDDGSDPEAKKTGRRTS